jgi:hypothetical protein
MESKEYYIQQFKRQLFKCMPKNLRKMAEYLVNIPTDFKPTNIVIWISENLLDEYSKYKCKKPMLKCSIDKDIDDIF